MFPVTWDHACTCGAGNSQAISQAYAANNRISLTDHQLESMVFIVITSTMINTMKWLSSINITAILQVAGVRSNLWQGAAAVASGAAFTNVYVGWGVKTERFLPLPPPPVAQEYDQVRLPVYLTYRGPHKVLSRSAKAIGMPTGTGSRAC